jgi:hypothetical protein
LEARISVSVGPDSGSFLGPSEPSSSRSRRTHRSRRPAC